MIEIPVFAELGEIPKKELRPAECPPRLKVKGWSLTPQGKFGKEWCAAVIEFLKARGSNAVILNEEGVLEFGEVRRDATP